MGFPEDPKTISSKGFISTLLDVEEKRGFVQDRGVFSPFTQRYSVSLEGSWEQRGKTSAGQKQKRKGLKSKGKVGNLVLGEEVGMNLVVQLTNQTLVGRASDRSFALKTIIEWAHSVWKEHLGYVPEIIELNRNWFAFNFLQPEHAKWVLGKNWSVNNSPLFLNPWNPLFDASREKWTKSQFGSAYQHYHYSSGLWITSNPLEISWVSS
jgi:hypothetical protein